MDRGEVYHEVVASGKALIREAGQLYKLCHCSKTVTLTRRLNFAASLLRSFYLFEVGILL
jgi:hypothetical protein